MEVSRKGFAGLGIAKVSPDPNSRRHAALEIAGTEGVRTPCGPTVTRALGKSRKRRARITDSPLTFTAGHRRALVGTTAL
jgi:hypothetical protein